MAALLSQLATRLKQIREMRQMAVAELAKLAALTPQYVHALERAEYNPGLDVLGTLARIQHVAVADFFAFPTQSKLRHRARDLILRATHAQLPELVERMQRVLATDWAQITRDLGIEEAQLARLATEESPLLGRQLAARLKQLRQLRRRRVADVAALAGLTTQYVYALERAEYNPGLDVLQALARVYQVDVADLFAFPTKNDFGHRARDLIVRAPSEALDRLVAEMEATVGMTWADVERALSSAPRKLRALSR
jgi:transcriptional regulator with XRE-family HTH domain